MLKKIIEKVLQLFFDNKLWKSNVVAIKKQNEYLKSKGLFSEYPVQKHPPLTSNYHFNKKSSSQWFDFYYSIYGKPCDDFMPVPVYYYIENCLNDRMLTYSLKEKNFYNNFLKEIKTPRTLLRKINGFYYDSEFNIVQVDEKMINSWKLSFDQVFIKPSVDSGGGRSIMKFEKKDGVYQSENEVLDADYLLKYEYDFVLQEYVVQHPYYSQFNPDSNNTLRFFIYRSITDDQIHILHTILRIGAKGSFLDHDHLGGVAVAIDDKNRISEHAIDIHGVKHASVNKINLSELDDAPFIEQAKEISKKIAARIYYGRVLALDFTVNEKGEPLFLELNCRRNGINQYQMHNGSLFKEFTKEILDFCESRSTKIQFIETS